MKHNVNAYREAGLEARWTRAAQGAPIVVVRNPASPLKHQRETWWMVDRSMFALMEKHGVLAGFDCATALGDLFSVGVRS